MEIPVLSDLRRLDGRLQRLLVFSGTNVISFQCLGGSIVILFARHIGMPVSWVGHLMAFHAVSTFLVMFTVPLVDRFGPKRIMMFAWGARCLVVTPVLFMPFLVRASDPRAGWILLLVATLMFSLIRGLGMGGWIPILHEVVPRNRRGVYFSVETGVIQSVNILVSLMVALVLGAHATLARFLNIYAIGIGTGLVSVYLLSRARCGEKSAIPEHGKSSWQAYRTAFADGAFVRYTLLASLCLASVIWLNSAIILYLRDALGFSDGTIMFLLAMGSLAVAISIRAWGRYADRNGSRQTTALALSGFGLAALGWVFLHPAAPWTILPVVLPVLCAGMLFSAAFVLSINRGMLCLVREKGRVGYANLWILGTAIAMGTTPILVGQMIEGFGLWGFRSCFLIACLGAAFCSVACFSLPEEGKPPVPYLTALLRPSHPLRTLGRVVWITLGRDASNQETPDKTNAEERTCAGES
ncbi:MFS transporter [bacterium]|nr:MFS transporter [bacterium]